MIDRHAKINTTGTPQPEHDLCKDDAIPYRRFAFEIWTR